MVIQSIQKNETAEKAPLFHPETCNDSFGPIGFVSRVSANRLKGFVGAQTQTETEITPIRDVDQLSMLTDIVQEGILELERTCTTRLSIRAIVTESLLGELAAALQENEARIEAAIPLGNKMPGMQLVYIGYNTPSRRDAPESTARNWEVRYSAEIHAQESRLLRTNQQADAAITMEITNNRMPQRNRITEMIPLANMLMEGFGYSRDAAIDVLQDQRNIISVVRRGNVIAGINVTEIREIPLDDGSSLQMAEITDCYIRPEYRGNRYHSRLLQTLMDQQLQNIDVVFTESNTEEPAMVNSVLGLGHRIAGDGENIIGYLEKHAEIGDGFGRHELRDLFVTYRAIE